MIIEKLTELDDSKRILTDIFTVVVISITCYYTISGEFVIKLRACEAKYTSIETAYTRAQRYGTDFIRLQKQLEQIERQISEQKQTFFSNKQAFSFFENIDAFALAHNLRLISREISKPESLIIDEDAEQQQQFLKKQSANITVAGNYFDIVEFINELTDRLQKVYITNFSIVLPEGAKFNPDASFDIALLTYLSEDIEK